MSSSAIQATTTATFRAPGLKPAPVRVFAKGRRKWIVASDVCRILGHRTDAVPKLVPDQERGHAAVLAKGTVESVLTVTPEGLGLLVAQSSKPSAKALQEWILREVLPAVGRAASAGAPAAQGELF